MPFEDGNEARAAGATYDPASKHWFAVPGCSLAGLVQWLPLRHRQHIDPPYIRINLIPQTSWGANVRAILTPEQWRSLRRDHIYPSTGRCCLVCGGRGEAWPVEADEVWHFDDQAKIQKLVAIVPLCPACHEVRSVGLASTNGRLHHATKHLAWVNRWSLSQATHAIDAAFNQWRARSRQRWSIDYSHLERVYGISARWDEAKVCQINRGLIEEAQSRRRRR